MEGYVKPSKCISTYFMKIGSNSNKDMDCKSVIPHTYFILIPF